MSRIKRDLLALAVTALVLWALWPERFTFNMPTQWGRSALTADVLHNRLQLPQGFSIAVYASGLPGARLLRFTETGDLLVSLTHTGRIVLLEHDVDADGRPDGSHDLLTGLKWPHGIDLYSGWLYVAETHRVGRIRFDVKKRRVSGTLEHVLELPAGGRHAMRTVRFGPDGWLYVSVGSSCNACEERDPRRAALLRARPDGTEAHLYASGLRNTVGFDWRPGANELYGTDNGRDFLGDDAPPCELNRIELGQFYGWPYANGGRIPDPDFGKDHEDKVRASAAPVHTFGAHTSPLGISFISGKGLPKDYQGAALVALHGSWNRTEKVGYEVVSLHFDEKEEIMERKFATGFELDEDVIGRPVDVAEGPDGAIYISDDFTGSVYRVIYRSDGSQDSDGKTD